MPGDNNRSCSDCIGQRRLTEQQAPFFFLFLRRASPTRAAANITNIGVSSRSLRTRHTAGASPPKRKHRPPSQCSEEIEYISPELARPPRESIHTCPADDSDSRRARCLLALSGPIEVGPPCSSRTSSFVRPPRLFSFPLRF